MLINALSTHIIHINLNTIFYAHIEHSPAETIYIRYYMETHTHTHTHTHTLTLTHTNKPTHTHIHTHTHTELKSSVSRGGRPGLPSLISLQFL